MITTEQDTAATLVDQETSIERRRKGEQLVRDQYGDAWADKNIVGPAAAGGVPAELARLALEQCYGDVWTRPGLTRRDRSMLTLGLLIASNHPEQLANHVLGALGNGINEDELAEVALHSASYTGWPAAGQALKVILETCAQAGTKRETLSPVTVLSGVFTEPDHNTGKSLSRCWHKDLVYHGMGADGVDRDYHGRDAMLGLLADTREVMDEIADRLVAVYPAGDDLAIAHVRAHRRAARTGTTIDGDYTLIAQVHNGLIVRGQGMPSADYRTFFQAQHEAARS
jgi:alkylhydroperoxidase/carboxymuconolactone decarboxylase family protein YurZ